MHSHAERGTVGRLGGPPRSRGRWGFGVLGGMSPTLLPSLHPLAAIPVPRHTKKPLKLLTH